MRGWGSEAEDVEEKAIERLVDRNDKKIRKYEERKNEEYKIEISEGKTKFEKNRSFEMTFFGFPKKIK